MEPTPITLPAYAELHCLSNFSFQRGASHPEELVERAQALGYAALAITDECSMAGVVRAHMEASRQGLKLLLGTEVKVQTPNSSAGYFTLVLLARNRAGYGQLCELITTARADSAKGDYRLSVDDWQDQRIALPDVLALLVPRREVEDPLTHGASMESIHGAALWLRTQFPQRCWLAVELLHRLDDDLWCHKLAEVGRMSGVPLVASGNVHMHVRSRKPLQDVITAVRVGRSVPECGFELQPNAEAHLRPRVRLASIYLQEWLAESVRIADLCRFSLDELKYEYPQEVVPLGDSPASYLRRCTYEGAGVRYPQGIPASVQQQVEHELALIAELGYGPSQLVQDATRHGVEVRPADVMDSDWDCTLEQAGDADSAQPAVRLGLRLVSGLKEATAQRIVTARRQAPFTSTEDLALRAALDAGDLKALASADTLMSLSGHRRQQVWEASALHAAPPLLKEAPVDEEFLELEAAAEEEEIVFDYAALGLSLRRHPLALLRERLVRHRLDTAAALRDVPNGSFVRACGLVTMRQQPETAKGVVFVTLEDETGTVNVIVWKSLREKQRAVLLHSRLLAVYGQWQREGEVRHLVAQQLVDATPLLGRLAVGSRDFR